MAWADLRGRIPIHAGSGQGPGLTTRQLGNKSGFETQGITVPQLPPHGHSVEASTGTASSVDPVNKMLGVTNEVLYRQTGGGLTDMNATIIQASGGSAQHANIQPFRCINFIIALIGVYPSRN